MLTIISDQTVTLHPPGWKAAWLAIGVFLVANALRLILLWNTGDCSLQVDYALIPLAYWSARQLGLRWGVQVAFGSIVAASVISGDLLDIMARRFNWSHGVIIDYAYSMPDLPWPAILPIVALALFAAGLCWLPFAVHRPAFPIWPLGILVGALLCANALVYRGTRGDVETSRLTRSFASHAVNGVINRLVIGRTLEPFRGDAMAKDAALVPLPPQILSVAMESFGLVRDPASRVMLLRPLLAALGGHYAVHADAHAFEGSTLPGEVRELCALQANGIPDTPKLLARLGAACLPARLRQLGYDTQALHGNGPLMYDRRVVYPAMGFNKAWFDTDLRAAAPSIRPCPNTAFAGVCDTDLFARALSLFDGHRRFVHVLTLDAHLPLPEAAAPTCDAPFRSNAGLCRYAEVTEASLGALGRAITTARHPPDRIVIYGDHAPPFAATEAGDRFDHHHVPYIVLTRTMTRD